MIQTYTCRCKDISISFEQALPSLNAADKQTFVWMADISQWHMHINLLTGMLSADELGNARRFRYEKDRYLYIVSHGLLRLILSTYTGTAPEKLAFGKSPTGKPYLNSASPTYFFNLSHSGQIAAIAVNLSEEVGIDVEEINQDFDCTEVAKQYFTHAELMYLHTQKDHSLTLFYTYWTRKEAFVKALGAGLTDEIKNIEVISGINKNSILNSNILTQNTQWDIYSFSFKEAYITSIACSSDSSRVKFFNADLLL